MERQHPMNRQFYQRYTPKKADKNQSRLVACLKMHGFTVQLLHETGHGVPDTLLSKRGLNILAEIKNGDLPPEQRKFTPPQKRMFSQWDGMICVLTCEDDCKSLRDQVDQILYACEKAGINLQVTGCRNKQYKPPF